MDITVADDLADLYEEFVRVEFVRVGKPSDMRWEIRCQNCENKFTSLYWSVHDINLFITERLICSYCREIEASLVGKKKKIKLPKARVIKCKL